MIKEVQGDLLKANSGIICHQVNCKGVMGAGVAKQIKDSLLCGEDFARYQRLCKARGRDHLGGIFFCREKNGTRFIANLFGEDIPTGTGIDTDYDALEKCLRKVRDTANELKCTVAIPGYIGCGLAGGDWNHVYHDIIIPVFRDSEVELTIVYWEGLEKASLHVGNEQEKALYAVSVEEILKRTVIVEAESFDGALERVTAAVSRDELLLECDDFDCRRIGPSPYFPYGKVPEGTDVSFYCHL